MSWSIALLSNEPNISKECASELFKNQEDEIWYELEEVTYEGKLSFNGDHMEHMDFLYSNPDLVKILKKHKVKGDITFANTEGDNSPSFWGYRFDGKGGCVELTGEVVFKPGEKL